MALELRINAVFGTDSVVVYDTTGTYDSGYNEGGYGGPNKTASDAVSCVIDVTPPNETTPISITAAYPSLPNLLGNGYEITDTALGLDGLVVGVWTIKMTVSLSIQGSDEVADVECKFLNDCALESCISDRIKNIDETCNSLYDDETFKLQMLLEGARENMCSGQYEKANDLAEYIGEKCDCCC